MICLAKVITLEQLLFTFAPNTNQPHAFHIVLGIAPVTETVKITQIQTILQSLADTSCCQRNLTCYESFTTTFRFMIEQNT